MSNVGVIDIGVLIGFTIKIDQHHRLCEDYLVNGSAETIWLPPSANNEFLEIEAKIRKFLSRGVSRHRQRVQKEVNTDRLTRSELEWVRDAVLQEDDAGRAYSFLQLYYGRLMRER